MDKQTVVLLTCVSQQSQKNNHLICIHSHFTGVDGELFVVIRTSSVNLQRLKYLEQPS